MKKRKMAKGKITIGGKAYNISADIYGMRLFAKEKGFNKVSEIQTILDGLGKGSDLDFEQMDDLVLLLKCFLISANEGEIPTERTIYKELFTENIIQELFAAIAESTPQESGNAKKPTRKKSAK